MIFGRSSADTSIDAMEQAAVADLERPLPELPSRPVNREKDELGSPNQILGWHVADGRKHTTVLRVVAIIAHHEVFAGRYIVNLCIIQGSVVAHLDDLMLPSIRQGLDVLSKQDDGPATFVVDIILDALARAGLIVNVENTVSHLYMIARQANHPLDIVGGVVGRELENRHVATLGGMEQYPPGEQRQPESQRVAAVPIGEF